MTADRRDLHVLAARMCLEHIGDEDTRGNGFVVVYVRRSVGDSGGELLSTDEDETVEIAACFGVQPADLDELRAGDDGWFGLESLLPAGEILEVLCRVMKDGVGYEACTFLEIVKLVDGSPAIEVIA